MWPSTTTNNTASRVGYGIPPEMGMFVVAAGPATTFHHHHYSGSGGGGGGTMISSHQHQHQHQHQSDYMNQGVGDGNNAATALGVGVIPLLADEQDLIGRTRAAATWQQQMGLGKKSIDFELPSSSGMTLSGTATCQDCGNQSKKDCSHQRCRTCCRSRGFDCSTHVKSTWIPAARRRERQSMTGTSGGGGGGGGGASSGSTSGAKKPRLISSQTSSHTSTSNTPPRSFDASSSHQDGSYKETLPGQVRAPAVFKCVKVTAVEDGEDEFAYQAVVKIGGHLFKGFLYDQGVESRDGFPNLSELHLGGSSGAGAGAGGGNGRTGPLLDPSDVYGASAGGGGGFIGGSNYGNTIN
ncbi:hypothetical protein RND81_04G240300 [Saponaria officinalis]|uniref:Uncharacterized protein n=1 Tax=Saponaria officinalis TaxID=3572 RepID=A0AAW1LQC0_SAPOF